MSGTSLDGVDAVVADFAPDAWTALRACRRRSSCRSRRSCGPSSSRCSASGPDELARAARAANALADTYADAIAEATRAAGVAAGGHRRGRRARPDAAPPARRRLDAAAQQSGARRRARGRDSRRRFPQPRRRRGRAGRAARAGVPRGALRRRRPSRRRQHRRHRQRHRPSAGADRCAASTPARATRCSTSGTRGIAVAHSTPTARGPRRAASMPALLGDAAGRAVFRARRRRRARAAISSTRSGSTRSSPAGRSHRADVQATLLALTARTIADAIRARVLRGAAEVWSAAAARTIRR